MSLPFTLPDWLPWWLPMLAMVLAGLYGLALLSMPFSVFGVKGRLDAIDARLDEIQGEIRSLSLRLPERGYDPSLDERPPIPPARDTPILRRAADEGARRRIGPPRSRAEPSFDPY